MSGEKEKETTETSVTASMSSLAIRTATTRDDTYFLEPVFFQVEDAVFQVPKRHFETNEVFETTFMLPPPTGTDVEGGSEAHPFLLHGIAKDDFRAFLSVLYPMTLPHAYASIPVSTWTSVLSLSTLWEFHTLRELSIEHLGRPGMLDPTSKILLGMKYRISAWLIAGCDQLLNRTEGPREAEAELLGMGVAIRIYDLREVRIAARLRGYNFDPAKAIQAAFKDYL